jgi:hypothetical protein
LVWIYGRRPLEGSQAVRGVKLGLTIAFVSRMPELRPTSRATV